MTLDDNGTADELRHQLAEAEALKQSLLVALGVLIQRLGGAVSITPADVEGITDWQLYQTINPQDRVVSFRLLRKGGQGL